MKQKPVRANEVPAVMGKTIYPEPFAARVSGRLRRRIGELFGLRNFGVSHTQLQPGTSSALAHHHTLQDEFVYVLEGTLTLMLDGEAMTLQAGDCYGFRAGDKMAPLLNNSSAPATYLEIGDRSAGDQVEYPYDDLRLEEKADGNYMMFHKDGRPY